MADPAAAPSPAPEPTAPLTPAAAAPAPAPSPEPAPGPAPAPAATAAATLAGGADSATAAATAAAAAATPGATAPTFPQNWREQLAGADKAALKDLEKYTDPAALYKSLRSLQAEISSGKLKAPPAALPENATDEQKLEWRKANGLPEKPEGYVGGLALPEGVVLGEADKPLINNFAELAAEKGWNQGQFNDAVSWFYDMQGVVEQQRAEADGKTRIASEVALRGEWQGAEYTVNMNAMNTVLQSMPEDLRVATLTARTAEGELLGNTAGFIKWAAQFARENNPTATIIVPTGGDVIKTVANEIKGIEDKMYLPTGQPNPVYWKDEALQARHRELIDTQQKMAARGAKAA